MGLAMFVRPEKGPDGRKRVTERQRRMTSAALLAIGILTCLAVSALYTSQHQEFYRSCAFCDYFNCLPIGWDCCPVVSETSYQSFGCESEGAAVGEAAVTYNCSSEECIDRSLYCSDSSVEGGFFD